MKTKNITLLLEEVKLFFPTQYGKVVSVEQLLKDAEDDRNDDIRTKATPLQWATIIDLYNKVKADVEEEQLK